MSIYINEQKYKCPCKSCKDRVINCHATCSKYLDWVQANEDLKNKERIQKVDTSTGWGYNRKHKKEKR